MIPAIVTDELSVRPETAFELGLEWGDAAFYRAARGMRMMPACRAWKPDATAAAVAKRSVTSMCASVPSLRDSSRFPAAGLRKAPIWHGWTAGSTTHGRMQSCC